MELFPPPKVISQTQYNLWLMTQTAPFQAPQQPQKHRDRKQLFNLLQSLGPPLASQLPDSSPDSVLITFFPSGEGEEVAVGSVYHGGGLQIASFPSLPPHLPCAPNVQQMLGEWPRSTQTLS